MRSKVPLAAGALALALTAAACGDGADLGNETKDDPRTIEVEALDDLVYDPASIEVGTGETVRFVVTNTGDTEHEFVVGDQEMQDMAEEQAMGGMHDHADTMASLMLKPGETAETVVMFDQPGELLYACHIEGHYAGGMIGPNTVT